MHRDEFLIIKPTRCTNFSNLFWNETLHVSDSSSVHHQKCVTVRTAMVYVIQVCWQLVSRIRMEFHPDPARKQAVSKHVWHIPLLCVQWGTPDDGQRNCLRHVEFHDSLWAVSKHVWHIPLLYVQWGTPDDGQRSCPKHVEFHCKNKFEKLVHLAGFIIRHFSFRVM